ncbi:MAG: FecR domain-containing protein [Nitrospiraceae bacterium]|nr:FecR domain-containing protein [Nitrospiraceae bacterium]
MSNRMLVVLLVCCLCVFAAPFISSSDDLVRITVINHDTLIGISNKLLEKPSQWRQIARVNKLKEPYTIFPGDTILVPARMLKPSPYPSTVTFVSGDASRQLKGQSAWMKVLLNDQIAEGVVIKTSGIGSAVELTYADGTVINITPDSSVRIAASGKRGETITDRRFIVETGRVISRIKKALGAESRFEIHTPSAVAGVKGTEFRTSVDLDKTTRSEVLDGVVELNAMNKNTLVSKGEGALVKKGEPPAAAVKLLPAPEPASRNAVYKSLPLELRFKQIEGASSYRVKLAKDRDFRYPVSDALIKPNELFSVTTLEDGVYYMCSSSIDPQGLEGAESAAYEIKLRVNPVPPFTQLPAEGAEIRSRAGIVDFSWLKVNDAIAYHLQIAEDRAFGKIVHDKSGIKATEYRISPLDYKKYYFRICSIADDGYEAAWSDTLTFTVVPPPPAPPVDKPAVSDSEIQIRWQKVQRAVQYHFQMSKDNGFANVIVDKKVDSPAISIIKPKDPGTYYVRTSSVDHKGYEGDFSQPQSFEIKPPAADENRSPYDLMLIIGGIGLILLLAL